MLRMKENVLNRNSNLYILLSIILICLLLGLGSWGLTETSESRYAEISKEMIENNDYLHPTLLGIYHYHKPPVTYQITALGYKIFGIGEFGARFFLQIALCLQLILVYLISKILFRDKTKAIFTALVYFALPLVLVSVRNLTTDAYLNTTILFAIYLWLRYKSERGNTIQLYLFYLALGLIMNIKGPVGLIFPIIFVISHAIIYKSPIRFNLNVVLSLVLFFMLSGAWVYVLIQDHPKMFRYFLDEQILRRINTKSFNRAKPGWFYLVLFPLMILPWLWPLVKAIRRNLRISERTKSGWLALWNIGLILLIFSLFSTKLVLYILPVSLYVAILSSEGLSLMKETDISRQTILLAVLVVLILIGLLVLPTINQAFSISYISAGAMLVVFILAILWIRSIPNSVNKIFFSSVLLGLGLIFASTLFFQQNEIEVNSIKPIIQRIEQDDTLKGRPVMVHNYVLSSAPFYLDEPVRTLNYGHDTVERDTRFQKNDTWKNHFIDIQGESGNKVLDSLMNMDPIILVRRRGGNIESKSLFTDRGMQMIDFDKWVLFY